MVIWVIYYNNISAEFHKPSFLYCLKKKITSHISLKSKLVKNDFPEDRYSERS